jgi:hypothetical protein
MDEYLLIVDTGSYSGNFEREMCAWVTGQTGECGVGSELANEAHEGPDSMSPALAEWCEENVDHKPDEHGCHRPCAISPTPGWTNNGMGKHTKVSSTSPMKCSAYQSVEIYFSSLPPVEIRRELIARANSFHIKVDAVRFARRTTTMTEYLKDLP